MIFNKNSISKRRVPMIHQSEFADCGYTCLSMISTFYGKPLTTTEIKNRSFNSTLGLNIVRLRDIAWELEFESRILATEAISLKKISLPCILHWEFDHYVVLEKITSDGFIIKDPLIGEKKLSQKEVEDSFTGVLVELTPRFTYKKKKTKNNNLLLGKLLLEKVIKKRELISILLLSVLVQIFAVLIPIIMQGFLIIGDSQPVKVSYDKWVIVAVITVVSYVFAILIRSLAINSFNVRIDLSMVGLIVNKIFSLPLTYFEKRFVGDVLSRISSMKSIRNLLANGLIESFIDGLMSIIIVIIIAYYSPILALVIAVGSFITILVRWYNLGRARRIKNQRILDSATESSHMIESIRGINTIKVNAIEPGRIGSWRGKFIKYLNSHLALNTLEILLKAIEILVFNLLWILILWLTIAKSNYFLLSDPEIFTVIAYYIQFQYRIMNFVEQVFEFGVITVDINRVTEILDEPSEEVSNNNKPLDQSELTGCIELCGLAYRYDDESMNLYKNITLKIEAGEHIAITGASGSGKSTLMKLIAGMIFPSEGSIKYDGKTIQERGLRHVRKMLGTVNHNDTLFSGSIADNIALFDTEPNMDDVVSITKGVGIHDYIMSLPMQYLTMLGELNGTISSGQEQRILIARAIYRKPKILLLDEATSHMDSSIEQKINVYLKSLKMTIITVAHRKGTINAADRIVELKNKILCNVKDARKINEY